MDASQTYIISEFIRNEEEKVRLGLKAYKGRAYFDVRIWFTDKESRNLVPSRKGICLNMDYLPQIREFLDLLDQIKQSYPAEFAAELQLTASTPSQSSVSEGIEKNKATLVPTQQKKYERSKGGSKPFTRHF